MGGDYYKMRLVSIFNQYWSIFHLNNKLQYCYMLLVGAVSSKPHLDLSPGILLWSTHSQQPLLMHHKNME